MQLARAIPAVLLFSALLAGCQNMPRKQAAMPASQYGGPTTAGQQAPPTQQPVSVDFRLAQAKPAAGLKELKFSDGSIWYLPQPVLARSDLVRVEPLQTQRGQAYVRFFFSQAGAQKLAAISKRYPGKLLVLTLNNSLVAVPQIPGPITNGQLDVGFRTAQQAVGITQEIVGKHNEGQR